MNSRKRAVSVRMNSTDVVGVKKLAKRLGVRDSDVIRCAVKMMMSKLGPLADMSIRGRSLVPVFVESGSDLFRHLDLDAVRLENIINDGVAAEVRVDHDDIQLIAMNGVQRSYVKWRLGAMSNNYHQESHGDRGNDSSGRGNGNGDGFDESLRQYLYAKYVHRTARNEMVATEMTVGEVGAIRRGS